MKFSPLPIDWCKSHTASVLASPSAADPPGSKKKPSV